MLIVSRQHTEYRLDILSRNLPKIPCTRQNFHHFIQCITAKSCHRDKVLCQHIQTLCGRMNLLDTALSGKLCCHAAGYALCRRSRKQIHDACPPRVVPGAPQTLHRARHRARTSDLQYLVNLPHINAQLHRRGSTQEPQPAIAQRFLRLLPLFFRKAAVMHARKVFSADQIHIIRKLLRVPSALHKSNHTAAAVTIFIDQCAQFLPDRVFSFVPHRICVRSQNIKTDFFLHVRCRDDDLLWCQILCCLLQRFYRGRKPDPL